MVDAPSDQWATFSQGFRESPRYGADVAALLNEVARRFGVEDWTFVETSEGSIGAFHAARMNPGLARRVILSSSLFQPSRYGPGLSGVSRENLFGAVAVGASRERSMRLYVLPRRAAVCGKEPQSPRYGSRRRALARQRLRSLHCPRIRWNRERNGSRDALLGEDRRYTARSRSVGHRAGNSDFCNAAVQAGAGAMSQGYSPA
jgi:pimeloyl-ACP methyl ester carboxylesterase